MESAIVTNIQGYSIHDGPGIRTVVFLKGCPLRCRWCANPENLRPSVQMGFLKHLCEDCGRCMNACLHGAIVPGDGVYRIDKSKCQSCGRCAESCLYGALVTYGESMTSEQVFRKVRKDKMFYQETGGVTVSGGEPLSRSAFVAELLGLCRADGIGTCIETCGYAEEDALRAVIPVTDWFYFDLKLMEREAHRHWTGQDPEKIHRNARILRDAGAQVLFRMPLIPGVNDGDENIEATAGFMKSLGDGYRNIQLMPYHRAGQTKYDALNQPYETAELPIMTASELETVKRKFTDCGVNCSISK